MEFYLSIITVLLAANVGMQGFFMTRSIKHGEILSNHEARITNIEREK
jgi:hypothetical protein